MDPGSMRTPRRVVVGRWVDFIVLDATNSAILFEPDVVSVMIEQSVCKKAAQRQHGQHVSPDFTFNGTNSNASDTAQSPKSNDHFLHNRNPDPDCQFQFTSKPVANL